MESSGAYSAKSNPGQRLLNKAREWAESSSLGKEAFFDWDNDLIIITDGDREVVRLPLRETLEGNK